MINIEENRRSEAQIRLAERLEKDREKLQEQIKKDHRKVEELKKRSKNCIGELFAEHLPDYYNFEAAELKEIIDTAMEQKATVKKIASIKKAAGWSGDADPAIGETAFDTEETDASAGEISGDLPEENDSADISADDQEMTNREESGAENSYEEGMIFHADENESGEN